MKETLAEKKAGCVLYLKLQAEVCRACKNHNCELRQHHMEGWRKYRIQTENSKELNEILNGGGYRVSTAMDT